MTRTRTFPRAGRMSGAFRNLTVGLALLQTVSGLPVAAAQTSPALPKAQAPPTRVIPKPVTVNRTVPRVAPPRTTVAFSDAPTDGEIFTARMFGEPFVPTRETGADENRALAGAIAAYALTSNPDEISMFEAFAREHATSAWRASVLANAGVVYRRTARITRALEAFEEAWALTADAATPQAAAVGQFAMGESLDMLATLGQAALLERQLASVGARRLQGPAAAKAQQSRFTLAHLKKYPERVIPSGPQALKRVAASLRGTTLRSRPLDAYVPTPEGLSMTGLRDMAAAAGLRGVLGVRAAGSAFAVPSIVHLRIGHYSAVVEHDAARDRYLIDDAAFGGRIWMSAEDLAVETSAIAFVPGEAQPDGWTPAPDDLARSTFGRSCPENGPDGAPPPLDENADAATPPENGENPEDSTSCPVGMPAYRFNPINAALVLRDVPVGCDAPRGPATPFLLTYTSREAVLPQVFDFGNVGPGWFHDWLAYAQERQLTCDITGSTCTPAHVEVVLRGGGHELHVGPPDGNGAYPMHFRERATLVRTSTNPIKYERRLPDGSIEEFSQADAAPAGQRRVFLTRIADPQGQALVLTYDSQIRLVAVTDAIGRVTTLGYGLSSDALKVTHVTDPYGRSATFGYDGTGRLVSITDVLDLTSSFVYGDHDMIASLTTPYGTTTFQYEQNTADSFVNPTVQATDPLGGTERLEFRWGDVGIADTESLVPSGFAASNLLLNRYSTVYWNKRGWALHPGDPTKATVTRWLARAFFPNGDVIRSMAVPHSVKRPLESRVWYAYPGQTDPARVGAHARPSAVARVLPNGTSQRWEATYNTLGHVVTETDPLGRTRAYSYATNGIDLTEVRQTTGGMNDLLATFANYTGGHRPQTVTDAAGQITSITYNNGGQPLSVTNAKQETTSFAYDVNGYLLTVTGAAAGAVTTYTYDAFGRVRTVTGPDGYVVTSDYDVFDRLTRTTYPDATYTERNYDRLDLASVRDPKGRVTRYYYDALRRLTVTRDALNRTVRQEWCGCGSLQAVIDGNGNRTSWERDLRGRIVRELRADGSDVDYVYDAAGRLIERTDPLNQEKHYAYFLDGALAGFIYVNAAVPTAPVSYAYDAAYGRMSSMTDGHGTTAYAYRTVATPGAGRLTSVDGPLADDLITYTYDALSRVTGRTLNGVSNSWTLDAIGRVSVLTDPVGAFTYTYDGTTARVATVTYPNGQTSSYSYFGNTGDRRLQEIHHQTSGGATLSRFAYAYDAIGNITTWTQQYGSDVRAYGLEHDAADQLLAASYRTTGGTPTRLAQYDYRYDAAGNRSNVQVDGSATTATFDAMNRLTGQMGGGLLRFAGTVSEPAAVTVQGRRADVSSSNGFVGTATVAQGTSAVAITATDPSGNTATVEYDIDAPVTSGSLTYDVNGNLASRGSRTFEWDAENRLVRVLDGGAPTATFAYDGWGRRVQKVTTGVTRTYVYDNEDILEDRVSGGATSRHVHGPGIDEPLATVAGGAVTYYLADHLGSVVQHTNTAQQVTLNRKYGPYGYLLDGSAVAGYGFTGREWDAEIGLYYYRARYYDPDLGRFISADPSGFVDGPNVYTYVLGAPTGAVDPSGRALVLALVPFLGAGAKVVGATVATLVGLAIGEQLSHLIRNNSEAAEQDADGSDTKRFTPDQQAVVELARDAAKKGNLTEDEAAALIDLAKSVGLKARGPEQHKNRPHGKDPHIHVGPVNHIPVCRSAK